MWQRNIQHKLSQLRHSGKELDELLEILFRWWLSWTFGCVDIKLEVSAPQLALGVYVCIFLI